MPEPKEACHTECQEHDYNNPIWTHPISFVFSIVPAECLRVDTDDGTPGSSCDSCRSTAKVAERGLLSGKQRRVNLRKFGKGAKILPAAHETGQAPIGPGWRAVLHWSIGFGNVS